MDLIPVNPISRSDRAGTVRRESHSKQRQSFASLAADDDPETERIAETGIDTPEDDTYALAKDDDSAILGELNADALNWPASIAARLLQQTETNDGYHG